MKMDDSTLRNLLALMEVNGLGSKRIIELLERFPDVDSIFKLEYERFSNISFVDNDTYNQIQTVDADEDQYQEIIDRCNESDIKVIAYSDERFPQRLRELKIAPLIYSKGDSELADKDSISIVGSRDSSDQSVDWTFKIAKELSRRGYVIVSGGARGIDTAAHRGALAGSGETICVLGSGLNNVYPPENEELIERISQNGLVISHRPPSKNVNKFSLLDRNKITSGLSSSLLIVTSSGQGGTASQYQDALAQDKDIFCPSPSLGFEPVEGILQIIDEGHAQIVRDISDIVEVADSIDRQSSLNDLS